MQFLINENETYINENDGLTYCSVCNEPKEVRHPCKLMGENYVRPRHCACEREESERYRKEMEERQRISKVLHNRSMCFHERRMFEWTFENDDGSVLQMEYARTYVENWDKMKEEHIGLMLWGDVGTGKTYMASAIANALIDKGKKVKMTDFAEISNISVFNSMEQVNALVNYDLLIIDDLGSERKSGFSTQNVFNVINRRWESGKPLIVTTNYSPAEIKAFEDEDAMLRKIYDRILEMCTYILVEGTSKREESAERKKGILKSILCVD